MSGTVIYKLHDMLIVWANQDYTMKVHRMNRSVHTHIGPDQYPSDDAAADYQIWSTAEEKYVELAMNIPRVTTVKI